MFTNHLLLWGIAFEIAVATAVVTVPPLQTAFETAVPDPAALALLVPFPFIVWGADETHRAIVRRADRREAPAPRLPPWP